MGSPHPVQNRASSSFWVPHLVQYILHLCQLGGRSDARRFESQYIDVDIDTPQVSPTPPRTSLYPRYQKPELTGFH